MVTWSSGSWRGPMETILIFRMRQGMGNHSINLEVISAFSGVWARTIGSLTAKTVTTTLLSMIYRETSTCILISSHLKAMSSMKVVMTSCALRVTKSSMNLSPGAKLEGSINRISLSLATFMEVASTAAGYLSGAVQTLHPVHKPSLIGICLTLAWANGSNCMCMSGLNTTMEAPDFFRC